MLFPVYILEPGVELPETGTYYILARDGLYMRKETGLITAVIRIPHISALQEVLPHAVLHLPKMSWRMTARMIGFLRAVHKRHGTEGLVLIHWNRVFGYHLMVPEQRVTTASVDYDKAFRFAGFQLVGSVHSHPGSAGHSSTDQSDEQHFDGLHVTVGYLDERTHEISSQVVVNGNRFPVPPPLYMDGVELVEPVKKKDDAPETPDALSPTERRAVRRFGTLREFAGDVARELTSPLSLSGGGRSVSADEWRDEMRAYYAERRSAEKRYRVVVPDGHDEKRAFQFPLRWMQHVTKVPFWREGVMHSVAHPLRDDLAPFKYPKPSGTTGDEGGGR